jgi:hypothetical protein
MPQAAESAINVHRVEGSGLIGRPIIGGSAVAQTVQGHDAKGRFIGRTVYHSNSTSSYSGVDGSVVHTVKHGNTAQAYDSRGRLVGFAIRRGNNINTTPAVAALVRPTTPATPLSDGTTPRTLRRFRFTINEGDKSGRFSSTMTYTISVKPEDIRQGHRYV